MSTMSFPLLQTINDPADLRQLSRADLKALATELRGFVIESVARTGGHLSSNLGTVELTIALHHVFNTPEDRLVWDVGHQTYPHKILTGRRDRMHTLRQLGGISGFPQRAESIYDTFGTAHSSTSISAALGMALAAKRKGENRHAVAIIGDGLRGAEQRRCGRCQPARGAERQRHEHQPARGRAQSLPRSAHERAVLRGCQERGQDRAAARAALAGAGQAL